MKNSRTRAWSYSAFRATSSAIRNPATRRRSRTFCSLNYDVKFPLFSKIDVNGANTHPLYKYLKKEAKGLLGSESIKWNFTKFLVDKDGNVVRRYASTDTPQSIEKDVAARCSSDARRR
jgi:Glutathione peroxidase